MYIYVHMFAQMKSAFPKLDKRHSKDWAGNGNAKFIDCALEKSFFHIYVHIYENLFFQNIISELGIAIANSIFKLAVITFWKIAFHMYIFIFV